MIVSLIFFFFNDTATTEIYTLSLHDALPISPAMFGDADRDLRPHGSRESLRPVQRGVAESLSDGRDRLRVLHARDRKSTRLNSSHVRISYAVFCLKKKKPESYGTHECPLVTV